MFVAGRKFVILPLHYFTKRQVCNVTEHTSTYIMDSPFPACNSGIFQS